MNPSPTLEDAIERLYQAFATYAKPSYIEERPWLVDHEAMAVLLGKRLRDLTPDDLHRYAEFAIVGVGEAVDYLYFLPRILEITATEPSWWPYPEITSYHIRDARPETWTAEQRDALDTYLQAVVDASIQTGDYHLLDSWICAAGKMGLDVRPFLNQMANSPAAVLGYFERNAEHLPRSELFNPFWEPPGPAQDAVVAWFYSDKIAKILCGAYGRDFRRTES